MSIRIFYFLVILYIPLLCKAQVDTNALENTINHTPADTSKVNLLNQLVSAMRENDIVKAHPYSDQAVKLSRSLQYKKGLGHALENAGWLSFRKGDYSEAFQLSTEAIVLNEETNNYTELAQCYNTVAAINFEEQQYQLAIENFKKAVALSVSIQSTKVMCRSLNNMAFCFVTMNETDSARYYATLSLHASEGAKEQIMNAFSRRILGDVELANNNLVSALHYYESCLRLAKSLKNNALKTSTLHRIGRVYNLKHQPDKALLYLLDNISLAEKFGFRDELERTYKLTAESFFLKSDLKKAFEYQSKYTALHDSTYNKKNSEYMAMMQIKFNTKMKQAEIDILTKDAQLKKEYINRQQAWMFFFAGCLTLLVLLAFMLSYNNKRFKKVNLELGNKNKEINRQAEQLKNLNSTKDKLFSIISHDLRSPVASLKGVMSIFDNGNLTQTEFTNLTKNLKQNLDFLYDDLDNLLQWAQSQLTGLQSIPENVNIKDAVDEKIALFKASAKLKGVDLINEIENNVIVFTDKNHVGLVLRNLIANAIKFNMEGGLVRVSCRELHGTVEITITDSGVGIHANDIKKLFNAETHFTKLGTNKEKGVGIGLLLTKEFIECNGGTICVSSEPGKGAAFTFTLKKPFVGVS